MEESSESDEERRQRIDAQRSASNIGAVLGLAAGAAMRLSREEQEIEEQEAYHEFYAEQECQWQQTM